MFGRALINHVVIGSRQHDFAGIRMYTQEYHPHLKSLSTSKCVRLQEATLSGSTGVEVTLDSSTTMTTSISILS